MVSILIPNYQLIHHSPKVEVGECFKIVKYGITIHSFVSNFLTTKNYYLITTSDDGEK